MAAASGAVRAAPRAAGARAQRPQPGTVPAAPAHLVRLCRGVLFDEQFPGVGFCVPDNATVAESGGEVEVA